VLRDIYCVLRFGFCRWVCVLSISTVFGCSALRASVFVCNMVLVTRVSFLFLMTVVSFGQGIRAFDGSFIVMLRYF
jgi:hypothetical protein